MRRSIAQIIADDLGVREAQVAATIELLDGNATVPFIARYRKEATGGLDDTQLRTLEERLSYLREMEDRRKTILTSIEEQGKLTDDLRAQIETADTKARLEDLYLPYRPKRRTKAMIAREQGLEPLADTLLTDPRQSPEATAQGFVDADKGVADVKAALDGARQILMERFAEDASLVGALRERVWTEARLKSRVVEGKEKEGAKFSDYFDWSEPLHKIPSHRAMALFRGRKEEVLTLTVSIDEADGGPGRAAFESAVAHRFGISDTGRPADAWLIETARWTWRVKMALHIELDLMGRLFERAEEEAITVFARNLRDLLLAAPAGMRPTLALDPGYRTGVKVAAMDATGKVLATGALYPHEPKRQWDQSIAALAQLCRAHKIELIAIGNGTASRETDRLAADLIKRHPDLGVVKVVVSEAGASVYSASELAAREYPELDVTLRGAVSIGQRLQDPLAALVKIEPKSIGVGQYQHDVSQSKLARALDGVVEDAVNAVGVEVNTASVPLLARVSGLSESLARNIVAWRDANGPFRRRAQLREVSRLGPKAFEQAAGFLRIQDGEDPLDRSGVHPDAYPVVRRILAATKTTIHELIGNTALVRSLDPERFTDETFGVPTVRDILKELEKPGRDPRPAFQVAAFKDGVETLEDLRPGMILEGVVSNVAAFGAFVDIGVHQDGLVHVSALSERFVKDPREVVKPGDIVKVKVMEVDLPRKRVGLSMRLSDEPGQDRSKMARDTAPVAKNAAKRGASRRHPVRGMRWPRRLRGRGKTNKGKAGEAGLPRPLFHKEGEVRRRRLGQRRRFFPGACWPRSRRPRLRPAPASGGNGLPCRRRVRWRGFHGRCRRSCGRSRPGTPTWH
ncbi:Tex family protein [Pararhodospirillum photometricum]|uniref:Small ribosomal subunit protein bS1 n=1 Tax=Pararhodospirillum photometricum DSM 122 TaxID=1150469 RepID=H6SPM5_PARPM|nr:RNA binding protein, putative [Pararhodospirillum photometricum DSM 122]